MIEVQVPKNIDDYEAALIGPLTGRQAVCFGAAAAIEFVYFSAVNSLNFGISLDSQIALGVILALPLLMLAIWKPFGMRAEVYVLYFVLPSLIGNKDRIYETEITYDIMLAQMEEQETTEKPVQKNKKVKKTVHSKGKMDTIYK